MGVNTYVQYTISAKQDSNWEASWISSLPTIIATIENMHAICWRQNIKPWIGTGNMFNQIADKQGYYVCLFERERQGGAWAYNNAIIAFCSLNVEFILQHKTSRGHWISKAKEYLGIQNKLGLVIT